MAGDVNATPVPFAVGDLVVCRSPGSWVDGLRGRVQKLNVTSSDEITGHQVQIPGRGVVVLDPAEMERVGPWPPCIDDLHELARRDPLVKSCMVLWERGELTFAQMLIGLVRELAGSRKALVDEVVRLSMVSSSPFVVTLPKAPGEEFEKGDAVGLDGSGRAVNMTPKK